MSHYMPRRTSEFRGKALEERGTADKRQTRWVILGSAMNQKDLDQVYPLTRATKRSAASHTPSSSQVVPPRRWVYSTYNNPPIMPHSNPLQTLCIASTAAAEPGAWSLHPNECDAQAWPTTFVHRHSCIAVAESGARWPHPNDCEPRDQAAPLEQPAIRRVPAWSSSRHPSRVPQPRWALSRTRTPICATIGSICNRSFNNQFVV